MATAVLLLGALNRWGLPGYGDLAAEVDLSVYLVALILTLVSGLLFGMIPTRNVGQSSPLQAMKSGPVEATSRCRLSLAGFVIENLCKGYASTNSD